jgi:hypothetical protein
MGDQIIVREATDEEQETSLEDALRKLTARDFDKFSTAQIIENFAGQYVVTVTGQVKERPVQWLRTEHATLQGAAEALFNWTCGGQGL